MELTEEERNTLQQYFTKEEIDGLIANDDLYNKCETLVERLFKERRDKANEPYIGHLQRVSAKLYSLEEKCAGLLHDTLEDIPGMTPQILSYLGIPDEVIKMVMLVTKSGNLTYEEEIYKIILSQNYGAMRLKIADIKDNSDPKRLSKLDEATKERLTNKYREPKKILERTMEERGKEND